MTSESPGISEKQLIDLLKSLSSAGDLKIVIIDSAGNIISDKLRFDTNNNLKIVLATSEILQPVDIQDHWAEAVTLLASGARTTSGNGSDVDIGRFIAGELCIDVTAVSGTFATGEGLRVIVEGKDEVSGKYKVVYDSYDSLGGMITSPTTDWLTITTLAFRLLRVRWEITGTDPSFTFSVSLQAKV